MEMNNKSVTALLFQPCSSLSSELFSRIIAVYVNCSVFLSFVLQAWLQRCILQWTALSSGKVGGNKGRSSEFDNKNKPLLIIPALVMTAWRIHGKKIKAFIHHPPVSPRVHAAVKLQQRQRKEAATIIDSDGWLVPMSHFNLDNTLANNSFLICF